METFRPFSSVIKDLKKKTRRALTLRVLAEMIAHYWKKNKKQRVKKNLQFECNSHGNSTGKYYINVHFPKIKLFYPHLLQIPFPTASMQMVQGVWRHSLVSDTIMASSAGNRRKIENCLKVTPAFMLFTVPKYMVGWAWTVRHPTGMKNDTVERQEYKTMVRLL